MRNRVSIEIINSHNKSKQMHATKIKRNPDTISFLLVDEYDVIKCINNLKSTVSNTHDYISNKVIQMFCFDLIKLLIHIINLIIITDLFPKIFKLTIILLLYKAGDEKVINSYRSISAAKVISKIAEKCLKYISI